MLVIADGESKTPSAINDPDALYAFTSTLVGVPVVRPLNTAVNVVVPVSELGTTIVSLM